MSRLAIGSYPVIRGAVRQPNLQIQSKNYQDADKMRIEGSPSFVLNEGRQNLYGNVGFRVIEANIVELLRVSDIDQASWG